MTFSAKRRICAERQAIRLHIESMAVTRDALKQRRRYHKQDPLSYKTAQTAVKRLDSKIKKAARELQILEERWKF